MAIASPASKLLTARELLAMVTTLIMEKMPIKNSINFRGTWESALFREIRFEVAEDTPMYRAVASFLALCG